MAWAKYGEKKEHAGKTYSGMRVGGVHGWSYPDGTWKERKVTPSEWDIVFTSHKHRLRRAPKGSGAEVGSEYHWYIVAHQWVKKVDENTYTTVMEGRKHLVAFKKPDWEKWNTQFRNQKPAREKVIRILEAALERLRSGDATMEDPWDLDVFQEMAVPKAETEPAGEIILQIAQRGTPTVASQPPGAEPARAPTRRGRRRTTTRSSRARGPA